MHLLGKGLRVSFDCKLGCAIGAVVGIRHDAIDAGYIDDMPFRALLQMGQEGHGAVHNTPEVDAHEPFKVFHGNSLQKITHGYAGIVDDEIHAAVASGRLIGILEDLFSPGHVHNMGRHFHPVADVFCGLLQARGIDVRKRQVAPLVRQVDGKHPADA